MDEIEKAYAAESNQVEHILGTVVTPNDPDRLIIEPWAKTVTGPILDVGSGTGRWTGHLTSRGHDATGLEPAERLVLLARQAHPAAQFCRGTINDLAQGPSRWAGVLAWYSIIHMRPKELGAALTILRSVLQDNGTMRLSFFAGPHLEPWHHPVAMAYRWPIHEMTQMPHDTGFEVTIQHWNPSAPHAYIIAGPAIAR